MNRLLLLVLVTSVGFFLVELYIGSTVTLPSSRTSTRKAIRGVYPVALDTHDAIPTSVTASRNTSINTDTETTEKETENETRDDSSDDVFYETWPPLQNALCGKGALKSAPNLALAPTLFRLARAEVFSTGSSRAKEDGVLVEDSSSFVPTRPVDLQTRKFGSKRFYNKVFFGGDSGMSIMEGVNDQGERFVTMYIRIFKCGNNQIRDMEVKLFKAKNNFVSKNYNGSNPIFNHIKKANKKLNASFPNFYYPRNDNNNNEIQPLVPFIYTAVRDPISHFLSGYNEVEWRQLSGIGLREKPETIPKAPYHLFVPYSSDNHELRKKRFRAFVEDILLEDTAIGHNPINSHFYPMSRVLSQLARYNTTLTEYIPTLSNLTTVWPDFMSTAYPNFFKRDEIPSEFDLGGQHASSLDEDGTYIAAKDVWKEAGPLSRALCLLHAFDYACFKDLPDGIPDLCRSVYNDHAEEIMGVK